MIPKRCRTLFIFAILIFSVVMFLVQDNIVSFYPDSARMGETGNVSIGEVNKPKGTPNTTNNNQEDNDKKYTKKDKQAENDRKAKEKREMDNNKRIEDFMNHMSLEDKIYQMFVITPEALTGLDDVVEADVVTKENLMKYPVGGLIYFNENLVNEEQTTAMLFHTQKYAKEIMGIPIFTCIDEEGGEVSRISSDQSFNVERFSDMNTVTDEETAYHVGDVIGAYLSKFGFNVDFAPDADVLTNKENKIIGSRSFSSDPEVVIALCKQVADGLNAHNVLATYKHFPGHGATTNDTHVGVAFTDKTYEELMKSELLPFKSASENNVDMIMMAHISVPNVIGDDTPCSLSYKMITEILRGDLQYKGLIITDAFNMKAISDSYTSAEAAVMSIKAGADLILMPDNFSEATEGVFEAVRKGSITEERINDSVRRILQAKYKLEEF